MKRKNCSTILPSENIYMFFVCLVLLFVYCRFHLLGIILPWHAYLSPILSTHIHTNITLTIFSPSFPLTLRHKLQAREQLMSPLQPSQPLLIHQLRMKRSLSPLMSPQTRVMTQILKKRREQQLKMQTPTMERKVGIRKRNAIKFSIDVKTIFSGRCSRYFGRYWCQVSDSSWVVEMYKVFSSVYKYY